MCVSGVLLRVKVSGVYLLCCVRGVLVCWCVAGGRGVCVVCASAWVCARVCVVFTSGPRISHRAVIVHALFLCLTVLVVNFWGPTVVMQLVAECLQLFHCL